MDRLVDFKNNLGNFFLLESFYHQKNLLSKCWYWNTLWIIGLLLFENWPFLFSGTLEKVWNLILKIILLTFPSFIIVLSECIINLIASTIVNIQIHRFKDSSHTRSSSMFSLIIMLIASKSDAFLLIEQTELLIDIQSYAVLFLRISVIRFFKVCYFLVK